MIFCTEELGKINYFIFPPEPQKMGLYMPKCIKDRSYYVENLLLVPENINDSPLSLSLNMSISINIQKLFIAGFDGYSDIDNNNLSSDFILHQETQSIVNHLTLSGISNIIMKSVTPSNYNNIDEVSIYSLVK